MSTSGPTHRPSTLLALARTGGAVLLLGLVLALAPRPPVAWRTLTDPGSVADPTAPVLAVAGLAVWALACWLVLGAALVCAGHLPGVAGRAAGAVAARAVPVVLRRTVQVVLGAGLALGGVGVLPAAAEPGAGGAAVSLDWPVQAVPNPVAGPVTRLPPSDATGSTAIPAAVVVASGDTLWGLADRALRAGGDTAPSTATVAASWPSWWSANRVAIGADPDLLRPGTRLLAPPSG